MPRSKLAPTPLQRCPARDPGVRRVVRSLIALGRAELQFSKELACEPAASPDTGLCAVWQLMNSLGLAPLSDTLRRVIHEILSASLAEALAGPPLTAMRQLKVGPLLSHLLTQQNVLEAVVLAGGDSASLRRALGEALAAVFAGQNLVTERFAELVTVTFNSPHATVRRKPVLTDKQADGSLACLGRLVRDDAFVGTSLGTQSGISGLFRTGDRAPRTYAG